MLHGAVSLFLFSNFHEAAILLNFFFFNEHANTRPVTHDHIDSYQQAAFVDVYYSIFSDENAILTNHILTIYFIYQNEQRFNTNPMIYELNVLKIINYL